MSNNHRSLQWIELLAAGWLAIGLIIYGGSSGAAPTNVTPKVEGTQALLDATALTIDITNVGLGGKPVVEFTVKNQDGEGMAGLMPGDLRFNIAKLVPGTNGGPTMWQNYINRVSGGAVQGTQERVASGAVYGTLINGGQGKYTYMFATDITNPAANPCPATCTDADGKALDISYQPNLWHRVSIQLGNNAYPKAAGVYDFVPSGSSLAVTREVIANGKCNQCHEQLTAHGTRVDVRLCATCHNRGSWVAAAGKPNVTVDFRNMVHKIHYGANLPSVRAGTPYKIGNADFSNAALPQDVRNCSVCHDGTPGAANATAQGDNWKMKPSMEACGACHDNVYFGVQPDPAKAYQVKPHPGGPQPDNSTCALCHATGRYTGSASSMDIAVAHDFPARLKAAAAQFKYNILSVSATAPGSKPIVTFSVTDPTNSDKPYDIKTQAAFNAGGNSTMTVKLAWSTVDFGNDGSGQPYGQPVSINALSAAAVPGSVAGTYVVTSPVAIPVGQTGTLRVLMEGHPAGDVTTKGQFNDRLAVKSVFKDYAITGTATPRRTVVDVAKCNACHGVLSLHGNNRTDEPQVCAACHNPNATDASRRPSNAGVLTGGVDGKLEESIDLKTMIHAIHAGQADKGGFRTKGIVVYGFGGSVNDFSGVVFPGKLNNCATCHVGTSYQLTGIWDAPTANGIKATTSRSAASALDASDNLRTTPISAVCSSCHDSTVAINHMKDAFPRGMFGATQAAISSAEPEACGFCHGAGKALDVRVVHGVK